MKKEEFQASRAYLDNHLKQMKKKIGEEIDHNLDLSQEGGIIQVIANNIPTT